MEGPSTPGMGVRGWPTGPTPCTLTNDQLIQYHSLSRAFPDKCLPTTLWGRQAKAYRMTHLNPPASYEIKHRSPTNISEVLRCMDEGGGMAALHLGKDISSFTFVMEPDVLAQFVGIYEALPGKKTTNVAPGTIKKQLTYWRGVSKWVPKEVCPKEAGATWDKKYLKDLDKWYADMVKIYQRRAKQHREEALPRELNNMNEEQPIHLQEGFEYSLKSWEDFAKKFKVSGEDPPPPHVFPSKQALP